MKTAPIITIITILLIAGCGSETTKEEKTECGKECFIQLANNCTDANVTITEEYGVVNYASSNACVFTKTVVSTTGDNADYERLFTGKSMTCPIENGKFDARLVNTVVFGIESCKGELKDRIVDMLAFV